MNTWMAVFFGGGMGSMLRYAITRGLLSIDLKATFPWATLASNLLATALLAYVLTRLQFDRTVHEHWHALLAIGFCGGFSTFSTFNLENYALIRDGLYGFAAINILVSIGFGLIIFALFAHNL